MRAEVNCDMGEGFGIYRLGDDESLMPVIDVANVACGYHASDPLIMHKTVLLAKKCGVRVGAHPSLPDLAGFGRREMKVTREELRDIFLYQVGALSAFLKAEGVELSHIKPHGSINGMSGRDEQLAHGICDVAEIYKVPVYGLPNTLHDVVYAQRQVPWVPEFYADLEYNDEGGLIITREHAAVDPGVAAARCIRALRERKVRTIGGNDIKIEVKSICVHSDTPGAVDIAKAVKEAIRALEKNSG